MFKIGEITGKKAPNFASLLFQEWVNKLFANLIKYKENTKVSVGIKFRKGLLTSFKLDSLTSMIECR